jgi:transposase
MDNQFNILGLIKDLSPFLNERIKRLFAGAVAKSMPYGGISYVSQHIGLSRKTITNGIKEIKAGPVVTDRERVPGGGRKLATETDQNLILELTNILEYTTRGDPEAPLLWTIKSTRTISQELRVLGHNVSHNLVKKLLHGLGYSLQSNKKCIEGNQHEDRNEQFMYINKMVKKSLNDCQPVISVDTKKKELVGNYLNQGKQWLKVKNPTLVNGHDFSGPSVEKAIPYGVYDIGLNRGFVNIGTNHDTSAFAVASIRGWWKYEGKKNYKNLKYIQITADGGGSNGYRSRVWKFELQKLATELNIPIKVCHFPPGTSKWNKIEHRLFSFISSNWRGEPLVDYETIVKLISNTTTSNGLQVECRLDRTKYDTGCTVNKDDFAKIKIIRNKFRGDWNYTLKP